MFKKLPRWMRLTQALPLKAEAALPQGPVQPLLLWTQLDQPSLPQISPLLWKAPQLQLMQEMPPQHKPGWADNLDCLKRLDSWILTCFHG